MNLLNVLLTLFLVAFVLIGCTQAPQTTPQENQTQSSPSPTAQPTAIQNTSVPSGFSNSSDVQSDELDVFDRALDAAISSQNG
ncbi:TPA: hypothetical protein HA244_04725 [Candidatus Micrarchaeota archaeon]|nr:hypothetical protein [Candidatus Micrarchaeota archaeon]